MALCPRDGAR